ncbi:hypothetical protein AbraCBS73388_008505 [Aspergillus brasiliensis]|uniref:Xylanolytic transcriptional activator regulatory domain-containing protein n=1 Tax=Aspergillus brasiliensis TaxID=319629 RepID=A0A9W5YUK1_9EURO|nr:hypothetical protein AbraCBS73388_008505 [Aspergillus brasiliensis]
MLATLGCDLLDRSQDSPQSFQITSVEHPRPPLESGQIVFVGEASPLTWLARNQVPDKAFHRPIVRRHVSGVEEHSTALSATADSVSHINSLQSLLLDAFCARFLPLYPIIAGTKLLRDWSHGAIPPLLKYSVLFIGAVHTAAEAFEQLGAYSKADALDALYYKAKQIYDSDTEADRICLIQSMFMLQFRFGSEPCYKNSLWWSSNAVSLAQTVGLHRSTRHLALPSEDKRLWKKIWWVLFVRLNSLTALQNCCRTELTLGKIRDRQISSGTGKPMMIDERDCDVEDLTTEDFVDGESVETAYFTISLVQIARIINEVVRYKYSPAASVNLLREDIKANIHCTLQTWQAELTPIMRYCTISNRNRFALILGLPPPQRDFTTALAFHAAGRISDYAKEILQYFTVNEFPIYAGMIVYSAMALHSAESIPSEDEGERDQQQRRSKIYNSCVLEFENMYQILRMYKLYFGKTVDIGKDYGA